SPTATPILYTVQAGDTWDAVAFRFGVETALLQATNPAVASRSLTPGQQIMIVHPTFNQRGNPVIPTQTPPAIQLPLPVCYAAPTSGIICYGELEHALAQPLERVVIRLFLFDQQGLILAEGETSVEQSIIIADLPAPYRIQFTADWRAYSGVWAMLVSADPAPPPGIRISLPAVEDMTVIQEADRRYLVMATLTNRETQPVYQVRVIVLLHDEQGHLAGYRVLTAADMLDAGETLSIQADILLPAAFSPVVPIIYAQAQLTPPV
ncbi:MAG: LysM peptidoglycan-binding domain-containing protein, partial [Anaerolineae bacterium]|nr:LysM peptidoglycan-binding domain-containing protein [Anaerolineae bacterium]